MLPILVVVPSLISAVASITTVLFAQKARTAKTAAEAASLLAATSHKELGEANASHALAVKKVLDTHIEEVEKLEKEILTAQSNVFSYTDTAKLYADTARKHKEVVEQHVTAVKSIHEEVSSAAVDVALMQGTVAQQADAVASNTAEVKQTAKVHQIVVKASARCHKCGFRAAKYSVSGDGVVTCASCDNDAYQRSIGA